MLSKSIDIWGQILKNPPKDFQEYFLAEERFLTSKVHRDFTVLDVGSGNGRTMKFLAPFVDKVIGIDNDERSVEFCRQELRGLSNGEVYLEDAEQTHFKDQSFDLVFTGLTFVNFAETKEKILAEIRRILKDQASFVFSVYHEHSLPIREKEYTKYGTYSVIDSKGTIRFNDTNIISEQFTMQEITQILETARFRVRDIEKGAIYYLIASTKD